MSEGVAGVDGSLATAGLCATCRHARRVENDRGSVFLRCTHATVDPTFAKYPRLPVLVCPAFAPVPRIMSQPDQPQPAPSPPALSRPRAAVSWSGGKDACLALHTVRGAFDLVSAVTMMDETGDRNRSHGLRANVLRAQVEALGLSWVTRRCTWDSYEDQFIDALRETARDGVTHLVCGDLLYPEHRTWVERVCAAAGLAAVEPLFGTPTGEVLASCLSAGIVARIIAVDSTKLGPEWLFRELGAETAGEFDRLGVDPCGEHGEYHTVVTHCPAFTTPVPLVAGEQVQRRGYWAIDACLAPPPGD